MIYIIAVGNTVSFPGGACAPGYVLQNFGQRRHLNDQQVSTGSHMRDKPSMVMACLLGARDVEHEDVDPLGVQADVVFLWGLEMAAFTQRLRANPCLNRWQTHSGSS